MTCIQMLVIWYDLHEGNRMCFGIAHFEMTKWYLYLLRTIYHPSILDYVITIILP